MYYRVVVNDLTNTAYYLGAHETLRDAAQSRKMSGDIVLDENMRIVQDIAWLWGWEIKDPNSYARRKQIENPVFTWDEEQRPTWA